MSSRSSRLDPTRKRRRFLPNGNRPLAAGQILVVGAVALGLAALLNAETIRDTFDRMPQGSTVRSVGLRFADPLYDVSRALRFDRPGEEVDALRGSDQGGSGTFAFDTATATSSSTTAPAGTTAPAAAPGSVPAVDATTTVPATAPPTVDTGPPTADDPAVLYIAGDSDAGTIGPSLQRLATKTGVVESVLDYKVSSGLARPDFFDWPKHLQAKIPQVQPDIVVVTFGGNDAQGIRVGDKSYQVGAPEWSKEYERRVGATMDYLSADGRTLIWVGIPNAESEDLTSRLTVQRDAVLAAAAARPDVIVVDAWPMFSGVNGGYADYVNVDGQYKLVRADDGFHLNQAGADVLAAAINDKVVEVLKQRGAQI